MPSNYITGFFIAFLLTMVLSLWIISIIIPPCSWASWFYSGISCPLEYPPPTSELVTTISQAQSGIQRSTGTICLQSGESFDASNLEDKLDDVRITFSCYGESAICSGNNAPVAVTSTTVAAMERVQFSGLVDCVKSSNGMHDCKISIRSPQ